MRLRLPVLLALASGCFGDPPAQDTESSTAPGSDGSTSGATGSAGVTSAPSSTADDTRGLDADADADATGDPPTSTTGPRATCDDGMFEVGEICFPVDATWVRTLEGEIVDLALASVAGDPGDGGVLVATQENAAFYSWTWDGFAEAGPVVSLPHEIVGTAAFVKSGDFQGSGSEGFLVASLDQIFHWYWDGSALVFDGPCPSEGQHAAVGNLDDDPALELAWVPADGANGMLSIWLDFTSLDWCEGVDASLGSRGKASALAVGPFVGDAPDDIAQALGSSIHLGEVLVPFAIGDAASADDDEMPLRLEAADLDGNGDRDELVVVFPSGVAPVWTPGAPMIGVPTPAGAVADLAVADLDGDGDDDVVLVDLTVPGSLLLLDTGGRTFSVVPGPATGSPNAAVAAADMNGDGAVDLVFGGIDGTVRAYLANP